MMPPETRQRILSMLWSTKWRNRTDTWIAAECGVCNHTVRFLRNEYGLWSDNRRMSVDGRWRRYPQRRRHEVIQQAGK
jgi:hypothetical protein